MAKEKKAKELKDKREQQTKELKEKREAEKLAIQARAAAAATASATGANPSLAPVRGGSSGDLASAARQLGKQATRVESSELARMRLAQRTLVYVIGLSPRLAKEELLRRHEQEEFVVMVGQWLAAGPRLRVLYRSRSSA